MKNYKIEEKLFLSKAIISNVHSMRLKSRFTENNNNEELVDESIELAVLMLEKRNKLFGESHKKESVKKKVTKSKNTGIEKTKTGIIRDNKKLEANKKKIETNKETSTGKNLKKDIKKVEDKKTVKKETFKDSLYFHWIYYWFTSNSINLKKLRTRKVNAKIIC